MRWSREIPSMRSASLRRFQRVPPIPRPHIFSCNGPPSPPVSLARVMLPYTLRDPYRLSHFSSDLYRALWPGAADYLRTLNKSANVALLDPIMPGSQDYALALDRMCTAVWAGADPETVLKTAAA